MSFKMAATAAEYTMMERVLNEHCAELEIRLGSPIREALANRILFLFQRGMADETGIRHELQEDRNL